MFATGEPERLGLAIDQAGMMGTMQVDLSRDDPLDDFTARWVAVDGTTRTIWCAGTGPGIVVMAEMPGISPHVARFARWVRDAGFTVYVLSFFARHVAAPYSIVTAHLIDEEGSPTLVARDAIIAFLHAQLDRTRPI